MNKHVRAARELADRLEQKFEGREAWRLDNIVDALETALAELKIARKALREIASYGAHWAGNQASNAIGDMAAVKRWKRGGK